MEEVYRLLIGTGVLVLGFFIGGLLAKFTKEELVQGEKWFKILVALSLLGGIVGIILGNDAILFSFFFIAIVTSRSLDKKFKRQ